MIYGIAALETGIADIVFYCKMERHIGFAPTISLATGVLGVMAGLVLMVHPGAGRWAIGLFFPLWFIAHCISRLTHLSVVRLIAGTTFYAFDMFINILGIILRRSDAPDTAGDAFVHEPCHRVLPAASWHRLHHRGLHQARRKIIFEIQKRLPENGQILREALFDAVIRPEYGVLQQNHKADAN